MSPATTDVQQRVMTVRFNNVPMQAYGGKHSQFSGFLADTTAQKSISFQLHGNANSVARTAAGVVTITDIPFGVTTSLEAIARDAGADLGVGGHLTALRRTAVGPVTLAESVPLAVLEDAGDVGEEARALLAVDVAVVEGQRQRRDVTGDDLAGGEQHFWLIHQLQLGVADGTAQLPEQLHTGLGGRLDPPAVAPPLRQVQPRDLAHVRGEGLYAADAGPLGGVQRDVGLLGRCPECRGAAPL